MRREIEATFGQVIYNPFGRPLTSTEVGTLLPGFDGYIAGLDHIDRAALEKADKLKVIARYGIGVDRVDLAAAQRRGAADHHAALQAERVRQRLPLGFFFGARGGGGGRFRRSAARLAVCRDSTLFDLAGPRAGAGPPGRQPRVPAAFLHRFPGHGAASGASQTVPGWGQTVIG